MMPKSLKLYVVSVVTVGAIALVVATPLFPAHDAIAIRLTDQAPTSPSDLEKGLGIAFWTLLALLGSAFPVQLPRGTHQAVAIAPIMASIFLGGPAVGAWVAAIGTTEMRELRGRIPWYGTLANHAGLLIPAVIAGIAREALLTVAAGPVADFVSAMVAAAIFIFTNLLLVSMLLGLRTGQTVLGVFVADLRGIASGVVALAPLSWLMTMVYVVQWWATALFAVPLYSTRLAYKRFIEMRDMFTQTIGALAEAVDKRDPYTAKHSHRVKEIAVDIGRVMRVTDLELEALEWGGLLHDVGKIGVPDHVLKKADKLTRDERMIMNAHPVLGAEIIQPVTKLAPELPIIRHHHEWYNGSGYPDRLIGDEIPKLARVLHVADAFEAMTAARPYRMTPLTAEQALGELRKFAGIQFDPVVVDAFVKTHHVEGVADPGRTVQPMPIPLIGQTAARMAATPPTADLSPTAPHATEQA
ncbi:MAG TPA: HD-GYP domain-containing protein [Candidatus Limnocylindrales bacterium]|nr:HD-GYP domain-containing protein [Candidatus Limnocylindrales bacterium]